MLYWDTRGVAAPLLHAYQENGKYGVIYYNPVHIAGENFKNTSIKKLQDWRGGAMMDTPKTSGDSGNFWR